MATNGVPTSLKTLKRWNKEFEFFDYDTEDGYITT